jgi:release factor glutamine methyltransferase
MTDIAQFLQETRAALRAAGIESADLDARLLLQGVLGLRAEDIMTRAGDGIAPHDMQRLQGAVARRLQSEPVSRILGERGFWKAVFKVTPDTLDPRPDSETVIEAALDHAIDPLRVLDIGTGTGCLLLSLLQEWPAAEGLGIDISAGAVDCARENAERLGLAARARFRHCGWEDMPTDEKFDVVVSNPPYIGLDEKDTLAPDVRDYDPPAALFAGRDGLDAYRALGGLAARLLTPGGLAVFEIGHRQADAVKTLLAGAGLHVLETRQDLGGNDRVVVARQSL